MNLFLMHIIAMCNMWGNVYVSPLPDTTFSLKINGNIIVNEERIPQYFYQDMTDETLKEEVIIQKNLDSDTELANNIVINIKCNKK